jgi:hypothetical protein
LSFSWLLSFAGRWLRDTSTRKARRIQQHSTTIPATT